MVKQYPGYDILIKKKCRYRRRKYGFLTPTQQICHGCKGKLYQLSGGKSHCPNCDQKTPPYFEVI